METTENHVRSGDFFVADINWDALGAIGEVAGAIGVVATLVYLAVQIRQNTQVTRASTAQQMTNNWVLVNLEMSRNKVVSIKIGEAISPEDLQIVLSFWRVMFHQWSNCVYQHNHGSLDDLLFEPTEREISQYARDTKVGPNLRAAWAATHFIFQQEFQDFMDRIITQNPIGSTELFSVANSQPTQQ